MLTSKTAVLLPTLFAACWPCWADTLTLTPSADTTLFETTPDNNLGAGTTLVAGTTAQGLRSRALIRFDVSQIPPGASISSASLQIQVAKASSLGAKGSTFELHRLLVPWGEGDKSGSNGSAAGTGEATWHARLSPDTLWTAPGGLTATDFAATVSSRAAIDAPGPYLFPFTPDLVADVQSWVDRPSSNFGWVLFTDAESTPQTARRFSSKEDPANAPALTVEFTTAAATVRMTDIKVQGTSVVLRWVAAGKACQLQVSTNLVSTNWSNLGPSINSQSATVTAESTSAFFRVFQISGPATP